MTQRLASIVLALGLLSSCALGSEHRANNPHGSGSCVHHRSGWMVYEFGNVTVSSYCFGRRSGGRL
jgi:hypothetical protein